MGPRIRPHTTALMDGCLGKRAMRRLAKLQIHEHIDCSLRHRTMLDLWDRCYDFDFAKVKFPAAQLAYWEFIHFDIGDVAFKPEVIALWRGTNIDPSLSGAARSAALRKSRNEAVRQYAQFLNEYAGGSLMQYVNAIGVHILPLMQSRENLMRITGERVADAVSDGNIAIELRWAPQLHTWFDMSIEDSVRAATDAIKDAPIPVHLIACALRHENPDVAWEVARNAGLYRRKGVRVFDLAADEAANPGVLHWWIGPAVLAVLLGLDLTIHLWETNEPTDDDIKCLNAFDGVVSRARDRLAQSGLILQNCIHSADALKPVRQVIEAVVAEALLGDTIAGDHDAHLVNRLGHGFRGTRQGGRYIEVCPTSNVVTKQVASIAEHPVHALFKAGVKVTINTDGLTLTGISGLTDEFLKLQECNWTLADLLDVSLNAVDASSFAPSVKTRLRAKLHRSYNEAVAR